jgi:hypothetical protein
MVETVVAVATTAAVVVALWNSQRALRLQRLGLKVEGRRETALNIAQWLQSAESAILAWHNPRTGKCRRGSSSDEELALKPGG